MTKGEKDFLELLESRGGEYDAKDSELAEELSVTLASLAKYKKHLKDKGYIDSKLLYVDGRVRYFYKLLKKFDPADERKIIWGEKKQCAEKGAHRQEPLSQKEFEQIVKDAPQDMKLPIYFGKVDGMLVYMDLTELKSVAMFGQVGISAVCNTVLFSMLKARKQEIIDQYFLSVCCIGGAYSWNFKSIPFANEYIADACTAVYSLLNYYNTVKRTLKKLSQMSDEEFEKSNYVHNYEGYKEYIKRHSVIYIFEGFGGPLQKGVLDESGLDIDAVKEAFENAYKYGIYIMVTDCFMETNQLAESLHACVNIEQTKEFYHIATIIQNSKVVKANILMECIGSDLLSKEIFE